MKEILTPQALVSALASAAGTARGPPPASAPSPVARTIPALRALSLLTQRWKALDSAWGPGGSVGFELATGRHVVTPQSDLDVVIYAHETDDR